MINREMDRTDASRFREFSDILRLMVRLHGLSFVIREAANSMAKVFPVISEHMTLAAMSVRVKVTTPHGNGSLNNCRKDAALS